MKKATGKGFYKKTWLRFPLTKLAIQSHNYYEYKTYTIEISEIHREKRDQQLTN